MPEPLLSVFDFQELELLLHGLPNIDMDDWVKNTEYTGGCLFVFVLFLCVYLVICYGLLSKYHQSVFYPHLISCIHPLLPVAGEFANSSGNKVVQWFWELVRSFEQEQKAKLLQFVTGEWLFFFVFVCYFSKTWFALCGL